jgi:indole-3-glycerol phosphate synthase
MRVSAALTPDLLAAIVARKRDEVAALLGRRSVGSLRAEAEAAGPVRDFAGSLTRGGRAFSIIAEIKRKSPSAGWIREEWARGDFSPERIAEGYERAGAGAISCLTDGEGFAGELGYLRRVKGAVGLPVLRKDFIIDAAQVYEARAAGADALLLIAECLEDGAMRELHAVARGLGMGVLVEAHDDHHLDRALGLAGDPPCEGTLVGVNNRDLRTMTVDLGRSVRAAGRLREPGFLVAESGIGSHEDLVRLGLTGVRIALVGETLMRRANPGAGLAGLLNPGGTA